MSAVERIEMVTEVTLLPAGASISADDYDDVHDWAVKVTWRGPRHENGQGGYAVSRRNGMYWLSRAGNWAMHPEPFRRHQYRWETLDEALAAARAVVDDVQVNRMTFPEFQVWAAKRRAEMAQPATAQSEGTDASA